MKITGRKCRGAARTYIEEQGEVFEEEQRYLEDLPVAFAEGSWQWSDLEWIVEWKSNRASGFFEENNPEHDRSKVEQAINERGVVNKVEALRRLSGVEVPMASAILLFMDPTTYTVLDVNAWGALQGAGWMEEDLRDTPQIGDYLMYLGACHTLAGEFDMDLRDLDRALWVLGG